MIRRHAHTAHRRDARAAARETRRNPAKPGETAIYDFECRRNGTADIVVFVGAHAPWRHVKGTARRTNVEFAECMRDLVDLHDPDAPLSRVVADDLSTHHAGALYEAFSAPEARRIVRRVEFRCTPKHAA